jgi:hypothetical protein
MAGILNNKERIIDFIITSEGKKLINSGNFIIDYATLTDLSAFYSGIEQADGSFVVDDSIDKIQFEAVDRFQDIIVPELEEGVTTRTLRTAEGILSGKSFQSGSIIINNAPYYNVLTGSLVINESDKLLRGIGNNFKDQKILATEDPFSDSSDFKLSASEASFKIGKTWNKADENGQINLEESPSIYADKHFSHLPNFKYLPPINVTKDSEDNDIPLADYPAFIPENNVYEWGEIIRDLINKQSFDLKFIENSRDGNILGQAFEINNNGIEKLTIIDYGEFDDGEINSEPIRVFFIGKILKDINGTENFIKLFTLTTE